VLDFMRPQAARRQSVRRRRDLASACSATASARAHNRRSDHRGEVSDSNADERDPLGGGLGQEDGLATAAHHSMQVERHPCTDAIEDIARHSAYGLGLLRQPIQSPST
jgi:hypothetical protein